MTTALSTVTRTTLPSTGAELDAAVADAVASARSANTRRMYRSQASAFAAWCTDNGVSPLPAAQETAARYLTARAEAGAAVATVQAARSAIAALHRAAGLDNPCDTQLVRTVVRGLSRKYRAPQRQAAVLTADGLAVIMATAHLPRKIGRGRESVATAARRGLVDRAIAGVLFQAGLRRSEAAALTWGDIEAAATPDAMLVHVRAGKTNQEGALMDVRLVKNGVAAALAALRPADAHPAASVFGLSDRQIARRLAAAARAAGLGDGFSGHSGRVGLASELTRRGASLQEVMLAGGWKSATMVARYSAGAGVEAGAVAKYL